MLRVRTQFSGVQGAPWLSTMYFSTATEDATSAAAAVSAVGGFWNTIKVSINNAVSYTTIAQVDGIDVNGNHTGAWNTTPQTGTGGSASTLLPPALQALVQWRTGSYVNNREVRGRTFIPGLTTAAVAAGGVVASGTLTTIGTAISALLGNATVHLCVFDRTHAGSLTVASGAGWTQYAVLRSRRD